VGKPSLALLKDKTELLIAEASDLHTVQKELPGYYRVVPLMNGDIMAASFTNNWAVSEQASENQQRAAMLFISFLLNTYSQNQLHLQHDDAIPLNRGIYNDYLRNKNSELRFIVDDEAALCFYEQTNLWLSCSSGEVYINIVAANAGEEEAGEFLEKYRG
jgi:ABC-type glycerol-3-phosphate transport system substrate-binding protein